MSESAASKAARIFWDEDGQPLSSRYDDVYFSRNNGLAESRYVFLQQNHLAERWADWQHHTFHIGETGFGSGLNFLAAWQLWAQSDRRPSVLHFISVENEPLLREDLARAMALWPELSVLAEEFMAAYPQLPLEGFHNFKFAGGQVRLTLIIDDAARGLDQLLQSDHPRYRQSFHGGMDAWFLDGFAPAKNPGMWQPALFEAVAALSKEGTSLATFTAAGLVRRELQRVGFTVEKRPGYGHKREMVAARYAGQSENSAGQWDKRGRYSPPWQVFTANAGQAKEAVVIGAGLAGCHTARALAERGWQVAVVDAAPQVASGASGNPQGIVYGKLSPDSDALPQFNLAALRHAQQFYAPYWARGDLGTRCGVLVLPRHQNEVQLQQRVAARFARDSDFLRLLSRDDASALAGVSLPSGGLFYPNLGWLLPTELCRALLDHANITVSTGINISALHYDSSGQCWQLDSPQGKVAESANVVVANSYHALTFEQIRQLPLKAIRGQLSYFSDEKIPLKTVVCGDGYIAPAHKIGAALLQSFGATFTLHEQRPEVLPADHHSNLDSISTLFSGPTPQGEQVIAQLQGRTAFRCSTPDYLPLVGPAPDYPAFVNRYGLLSRNARTPIHEAGCFLPGLYLNVGHGSRGLAYAALTAEILAAQMNAELLPVARDLATALNPGRFIIRDLIRRRIS